MVDLAIILEEEILYCSNEEKLFTFEMILFIKELIKIINPNHTWRLYNVVFRRYRTGKERLVIKHFFNEENQSVFFCINCLFEDNTSEANKLLNEFYEDVKIQFNTIESLREVSKDLQFKETLNKITDNLGDKYNGLLKEGIEDKTQDSELDIENKIIFCGISNQGTPLISHLFDKSFLEELGKELNNFNILYLNSNLSALLSTISMNALIRARVNMKEIHFIDLEAPRCTKLFLIGQISGMDVTLMLRLLSTKRAIPERYTLDFFASGDVNKLKKTFKLLKNKLSKDEILNMDFGGDLTPFKGLEKYFDELRGTKFE